MSLREDVYELLCLFESANPREAFKPHLQPTNWRQREKQQLHFRTQVPDRLEPAFDIALGEGMLEQHLLKPEDQLELYRLQGMPIPPQDKPWPVFPACSDSLVVITEKGRGALAEHKRPKPEEPPLKEQVLDALTEQQRKILECLWDCKHGLTFDKIMNIPGAFRSGSSRSDQTIKDKVKAIRLKLDKKGLPDILKVSGRRLILDLPPG